MVNSIVTYATINCTLLFTDSQATTDYLHSLHLNFHLSPVRQNKCIMWFKFSYSATWAPAGEAILKDLGKDKKFVPEDHTLQLYLS